VTLGTARQQKTLFNSMLSIRCTIDELIDLLCPESSGMVGKAESAVSSATSTD
jgi:hypothetical protein